MRNQVDEFHVFLIQICEHTRIRTEIVEYIGSFSN